MPPVPLPLAPEVNVIAKASELARVPLAGRRGAAGRSRVYLEAYTGIVAGRCTHRTAQAHRARRRVPRNGAGALTVAALATDGRIGAVAIAIPGALDAQSVVADVTRRILVNLAGVGIRAPTATGRAAGPTAASGATASRDQHRCYPRGCCRPSRSRWHLPSPRPPSMSRRCQRIHRCHRWRR